MNRKIYLLKTGSLLHPFSLTPFAVGSIRKWRTSSLDGSPLLFCTFGGGVATFKAKPKAPGNEFESLTTNVPGSLSFNKLIAEINKVTMSSIFFSIKNAGNQIMRYLSSSVLNLRHLTITCLQKYTHQKQRKWPRCIFSIIFFFLTRRSDKGENSIKHLLWDKRKKISRKLKQILYKIYYVPIRDIILDFNRKEVERLSVKQMTLLRSNQRDTHTKMSRICRCNKTTSDSEETGETQNTMKTNQREDQRSNTKMHKEV